MKKYQVKINNLELEITQDDDGKFITPNLCIEDWGKFGSALKPAYEPIIMARKPFKGTLVNNVLENRVGGLNIDECRVGDETVSIHNAPAGSFAGGEPNRGSDTNSYRDSVGRFPANVFWDENLDDLHARYFFCPKASKRDRDEGLENFEAKEGHTKGNGLDRVCEFCGVSQLKPELCKCPTKSWVAKPQRNFHPTVKPTALMQYLVRLVSPKGATILDPFMGSGSTGKAVAYENMERNADYKFIGIELDPQYCKIAEARIEAAKLRDK